MEANSKASVYFHTTEALNFFFLHIQRDFNPLVGMVGL